MDASVKITHATYDLLIKIDQAEQHIGGAIVNPQALKRFQKLERAGLIEIHIMASGRYCARLTPRGRDELLAHCAAKFLMDASVKMDGEEVEDMHDQATGPAPETDGDSHPSVELLVTDDSLRGHMAMWVCRLHPYHSTEGVDAINALITARAVSDDWQGDGELRMRKFSSYQQILHWLEDVTRDHPQLTAWNTPRSGHTAELVFISRYNTIRPENDFIDIGALLRNVALNAWREAERDAEFDRRFDAEQAARVTAEPSQSGTEREA